MADEAHEHETTTNGDVTTESGETCATCSKPHQGSEDENASGQVVENTFQVTVRLPHHPYKTQTIVSTQDQAQDIRQSIIDVPHTFQYSCFHLECNGERIPDYVDLGEVPGVNAEAELTLVEDPYTEKDARLHVLRIREVIGASGDRTSLQHGIEAGLSLHDGVSKMSLDSSAPTTNGHTQNSLPSDKHALNGYAVNGPESFDAILPRQVEPPPSTIKSLSLSQWNPPPYRLRTQGHLLYLQLTTNEGEQYQVTSHISGFFVNKCSNSKFDPFPKPAPKAVSAHSLLTLISRLSPSFDASFKSLQDYNSQRDVLSAFHLSNAIPASPWLIRPSSATLATHVPDLCRTQESYLVSGADNAENLRDWNEEFQTTRELPKETVHDRVFRERVTSKLFADYNEAAAQGAVLIARGEVAPLNPTEGKFAQIFVYNNIFYSFGADGVGTFANEGGDEAARAATGKDVMGVKSVNQLDIKGLFGPGTIVVDYLGKRIVGQSIVPGIFKQREPGEQQIDYGGVEGKDVVATNEEFVDLFKQLSTAMRLKKHPVWDKEAKRHDLEASIETKGLLGTDGRKYVLDLYRITPLDIAWIEQHWIEPTQPDEPSGNGASGSYPHRMTVLRPELVEAIWSQMLRDYVKANMPAPASETKEIEQADVAKDDIKTESKELAEGSIEQPSVSTTESNDTKLGQNPQRVDISGFQFAFNPDVFSGQNPQTDEEKQQWAKDEAEVRAACDYLQNEVIPRLLSDLQEGEIGFPMDGQSLCTLLHRRGINIRYLGRIAELASRPDPRLHALKRLAEHEMIARAFKHVANGYLRNLPPVFSSSCVSHLLNCLLGKDLNESPQAETDESLKSLYPEADFAFEKASPKSVQEQIASQAQMRYRYSLPAEWASQMKKIQMLREISHKLGLQLHARDYEFSKSSPSETPASNGDLNEAQSPIVNGAGSHGGGKKKKKGGDQGSPNRAASSTPPPPTQTFHPEDVLNFVPVIKEASPKSVLAEEALEAGRVSVVQGQREIGQELLLESLSLHEQIYGILHAEVARVYYQLSTLFYSLEDKNIAVELARKAVIVSERTLGVDSNETVLAYLNLGLMEHAAGNTQLALTFIRHALDVWKIVFGPKHPDAITTLNNAAVMLQQLKLFHESRIWFENTLELSQEVSGKSSVNTATLLFQLAQALALDQDPKGAVSRMREAYNIFNSELGPEDRNTKEAETWLEQLTQNAVSIAKHAKDLQARRLRRINQFTPSVTMRTKPQTPAAAAAHGTASADPAATAAAASAASGARGLDERSIDELLNYIEGGDASKASMPKKRPANPKRRQQKAS